jgi:hypothetical protein
MTQQPGGIPITLGDLARLKDRGLQGPELYAAAAQMQRPERAEKWTPEKLGGLRDIAHGDKREPWMTDQVIGLIDTANEFSASGQVLPTELTSFLDTLPEINAPTLPTWEAGELPPPPTNFGMTDEQLASLQPWQQTSMNVMGSKPMGAFTTALSWAEQNVPAWTPIMNALDLLARGAKRTVGMVELAQSKSVSIGDIMANLESAWTAAEQAYRVTPLQQILPGTAIEQALGVGATPEAWKFGTTETTQLKPEQYGPEALAEFFQRLNGGEDRKSIEAEFEDRFGYQGMMRDMVGMMVADPLNFAGGFLAKGASAGIKAGLKGSKVALSAETIADVTRAASKAHGPVEVVKRFNAAAGELLKFDEWDGLPKILKRMAPVYNSDGVAKMLDVTKGGLLDLTPESQARQIFDTYNKTMPVVLDKFGYDDKGLTQARTFLKALKNNDIDTMAATGMRLTGGADFGVVQAFLKDGSIDEMIGMIDDYLDNPLNADMRRAFQEVQDAAGYAGGKGRDQLIKLLTDPEKAEANAVSVLRKAGKTDIDPGTLASMGKYFASSEGAADGRQLMGKLYANSSPKALQWAADHVGITEDKAFVRWTNLIKAAQGLVLLDLNPNYLIQNFVDNKLKMVREGLVFSRQAEYLLPARAAKIAERVYGKGKVPPRLAGGFSGELGLVSGEDAIRKAQQVQKPGLPEKMTGAISGVRKYMPGPKIAEFIESRDRLTGNMVKFMQTWTPSWKEGRAYQKLAGNVEAALPERFARQWYDVINHSMNQEELAAGVDKLLKGVYTKTAEDMIDEALRFINHPNPSEMKGAMVTLGLDEALAKIPMNAGPDDVRKAFGDIYDSIEDQARQYHKSYMKGLREEMANLGTVEGGMGYWEGFDEVAQMRFDQRMQDWRAMHTIMDPENFISSEHRTAVLMRQYDIQRSAWHRLNEETRAIYDETVKHFGADSEMGAFLSDNLKADEKIWSDFFTNKQKQITKMSKLKKDPADPFQREAWAQYNADMSKAYEEAYNAAIELQNARDMRLADVFVAKYGEDIRPAVEKWLGGVRKLDAEAYEGMLAHYDRVKSMPAGMREAEWEKFLNENHYPRMAKRLADNREGARSVWRQAHQAELDPYRNIMGVTDAPEPVRVEDVQPDSEISIWNRLAPLTQDEFAGLDFKVPEGGSSKTPKTVFGWDRGEYETLSDLAAGDDTFRFNEALGKGYESDTPNTMRLAGKIKSGNQITIYRASDVGDILPGSYVSESRKYVESHGENIINAPYEIFSMDVYPDELMTYGDPHEFIYIPRTKEAGYQRYLDQFERGNKEAAKLVQPADAGQAAVRPFTDAFKAWFGKSAVVDADGQPLRAYHGTTADFAQFDPTVSKATDDGFYGKGIYFSTDPEMAGGYATRDLGEGVVPGGNVRPVYLNIENPFKTWDMQTVKRRFGETSAEQTTNMKKAGYDGVFKYDENNVITEIVAFEPDQIKPAFEGFADMRTVDLIGKAPPGTMPRQDPIAKIFTQGIDQQMRPFLRQVESQFYNAPRKVDYGELTSDQIRVLRQHADAAAGSMSDLKLAATKYASIATDNAMLDYSRRYGFDTYLSGIFPYQFWYTRSAMNWALSAIDHPAWYAQWHRLREMQDKLMPGQDGFPSRLAGKMQIPIPFMPEGWGSSIYVDPMHNIFGFEGMASQVARPLQRDQMNRESRAQYILEDMMRTEQITQAQYEAAVNSKGLDEVDPLWAQAMQQAEAEVEAEIASPLDMISTVATPSLPLQWALERMGLLKSRNRGIGTLPLVSTIQNATSFIEPGGVNVYQKFQAMIGAAEGKGTKNARGFLWDYYVARELSNMAAQGEDVEAVKLAMVDKTGPLYEQAVDTVGRQQAVRSFASILWTDFFPEGEQRQRALKLEFEKAADAGKMTEFFDKYPEYEARMLLNKWEDPEQTLRYFERSAIWDAYYKLDPLEQRAFIDQNPDFEDMFLNKETRSYDSVTTETMTSWLRTMKGVVPETAPATPPSTTELPEADINQAYNGYVAWRDSQPGYQLYNVMNSLPYAMQANFRMQHPEVVQYKDARNIFLSQNPELIQYVISDDNKLAGAPPDVQAEVYRYEAAKSLEFPMIQLTNDMYWNLGKSEQRAFLRAHPELKDYWDWEKEAVKYLSAQAFYYVKGESGIEKLRQGDDYEAPYYLDFDKFSPPLVLEIARETLVGGRIGAGATRALRAIWEGEGKPLQSFDAWLARVMDEFSWPR